MLIVTKPACSFVFVFFEVKRGDCWRQFVVLL